MSQLDKVLLGSMVALALMTVLSVIIGLIFHSVPAQFQTSKSIQLEQFMISILSAKVTYKLHLLLLILFGSIYILTILMHSYPTLVVLRTALPIGEYAAVTLLMFFGLKSIKDAWELPSNIAKSGEKSGPGLDEYVEAEELVKEKVSKRLTNPLEIIWKSFSLVFFAEWGDRSMLATIALGAAQSPWGVAGGAIVGHLIATSIAVLGGAFLANYISEKLVGYIGGVLFLVFAAATFFGVF